MDSQDKCCIVDGYGCSITHGILDYYYSLFGRNIPYARVEFFLANPILNFFSI